MIQQGHLPPWLGNFVVTLGGGGLFAVSFLDSSILSFPFVADAMVIDLSVEQPSRMLYYATMATIGSLAGCIWLFLLAKKGGEAFFRKRAGLHAERTQRWVRQNAFMTMFISSILPPPLPLFKVVVLAEGVFQVRWTTFVASLLLGRGLRFLAEGMLGVRYGRAAIVFMEMHRIAFVGWGLASLVALWIVAKIMMRESHAGGRA